MPYASASDLQAKFGNTELLQIADYDANGTADPTALDTALTDASAEIDAYLGIAYTLPLPTPAPPLLVRLCLDLARYALYKDQSPENVRKNREDAISLLKRIATGEATIPGLVLPVDAAPTGALHVNTSARVFSDALFATYPHIG